MGMRDFTLREYTQEEYEADLKKMIAEKGLHDAVQDYTDKIMEEVAGLSYIPYMTVSEYCCDILKLIELEGSKE
jgi:hypothetical protein